MDQAFTFGPEEKSWFIHGICDAVDQIVLTVRNFPPLLRLVSESIPQIAWPSLTSRIWYGDQTTAIVLPGGQKVARIISANTTSPYHAAKLSQLAYMCSIDGRLTHPWWSMESDGLSRFQPASLTGCLRKIGGAGQFVTSGISRSRLAPTRIPTGPRMAKAGFVESVHRPEEDC